jgi:hypothetical protein
MQTLREKIVANAKWGVANAAQIHYSEGAQRMEGVNHPFKLPLTSDCSAFVTDCYNWAGAPDPNGNNYNGYGYTGTLLSHGTKIPLSEVQPGDVIVYGPGTGWHTAIVVEAGPDPLTISMGQESDPSYVRVSQDGRLPQTYLRFLPVNNSPAIKPTPPVNNLQNLPLVKKGDKNTAVRVLQNKLSAKGYKVALDGVFGDATYAAVRDYQAKNHLQVDGICGPDTWKALVS